MTNLVLVDENDNELGLKEKFAVHKIPVPLHRAISIVIYSPGREKMLITKRADTKPTWPLFWSNAVCTHPYDGESYKEAADRRIFEELGFKTPLSEVFHFTYSAEMDNKIWGEHELDYVFVGEYEGEVKPNAEEIADYEWIDVKELEKDMEATPGKYTPWMKIILNKLQS
jgi:isopentenyl-diphosphate delta-isomerase